MRAEGSLTRRGKGGSVLEEQPRLGQVGAGDVPDAHLLLAAFAAELENIEIGSPSIGLGLVELDLARQPRNGHQAHNVHELAGGHRIQIAQRRIPQLATPGRAKCRIQALIVEIDGVLDVVHPWLQNYITSKAVAYVDGKVGKVFVAPASARFEPF